MLIFYYYFLISSYNHSVSLGFYIDHASEIKETEGQKERGVNTRDIKRYKERGEREK